MCWDAVGSRSTVGAQAPDEESTVDQPCHVPAASPTTAAARAVDLTKVYGSGDTQVVALDAVSCDFERGQFTAIMGPSGSGKSTLMHCLAGLDTVTCGAVFIGDTDLTDARRQAADPAAPGRGRLHLPGVQPAADADRDGEHHAADGHRRPQARPGVAGHGRSTRSACATGSRTGRPSSPAASSSGSPAPARWPAGRRSSSPTSRPATSTRAAGAEVLGFLRRLGDATFGQTIVMVTHDPVAAAYADRVLFLADGRIVDEMADPTAEPVLDRMKKLRGRARRGRRPMIRATFRSLIARKLRLAPVLAVGRARRHVRLRRVRPHRHPGQGLRRPVQPPSARTSRSTSAATR